MDTSEARNRKVVSVEKFDLEIPETAHQISSGSDSSYLSLCIFLFISHYIFLSCFVSLFGCYNESTCRLLRDLENTFALSLESVYSIGDWCSVF